MIVNTCVCHGKHLTVGDEVIMTKKLGADYGKQVRGRVTGIFKSTDLPRNYELVEVKVRGDILNVSYYESPRNAVEWDIVKVRVSVPVKVEEEVGVAASR